MRTDGSPSGEPAFEQHSPGTGEPPPCPECDGPIVTNDADAERYCDECGFVLSDLEPDTGPEWRAFDAAERAERSRVGAPATQLLHDKGLSTTIGWRDVDATGRPIEPDKRRRLSRLRTWDERFRTKDARERNLKYALGEIDRMACALGVPYPTSETASVLYRKALEKDLLPGRSIEGMATASLYGATRLDEVARSIDEFTSVSRVDSLEIQRAYRHLVRELDLVIPPTNPIEYVGRFASELDCTDETEQHARELIKRAIERGVHSGKHPAGIAASALYAASVLTNDAVTQADVSDVSNISEVTIRNRYPEILDEPSRDRAV
jgi:transcription initiation factor TFIIB